MFEARSSKTPPEEIFKSLAQESPPASMFANHATLTKKPTPVKLGSCCLHCETIIAKFDSIFSLLKMQAEAQDALMTKQEEAMEMIKELKNENSRLQQLIIQQTPSPAPMKTIQPPTQQKTPGPALQQEPKPKDKPAPAASQGNWVSVVKRNSQKKRDQQIKVRNWITTPPVVKEGDAKEKLVKWRDLMFKEEKTEAIYLDIPAKPYSMVKDFFRRGCNIPAPAIQGLCWIGRDKLEILVQTSVKESVIQALETAGLQLGVKPMEFQLTTEYNRLLVATKTSKNRNARSWYSEQAKELLREFDIPGIDRCEVDAEEEAEEEIEEEEEEEEAEEDDEKEVFMDED